MEVEFRLWIIFLIVVGLTNGKINHTEVLKMRAKFISDTLSRPQFSLMRKAMLDRARHPPLHKDIPPISFGMAMRIEKLERNAEKDKKLREKFAGPSLEEANQPIADLLVQGDLLLNNIQMKSYDKTLQHEDRAFHRKRVTPRRFVLNDTHYNRGKRQILTDVESGFPLTKWPTDTPICYRFHITMDNWMRTLVNEATKFWQANTCLSFKENCTTEPVVRYIRAGGCYSSVGKQYQDFEQDVSLGQKCDLFGVAAHETGHTLGLFHHQSRVDRDDHISLVTQNIPVSWLPQYDKVDNKTASIMDVHYDYGSDLHYPGYDLQNSKVLLAAKKIQYQHTMGNRRAPSFLDLKLVNQFYGCLDKCETKPDCKNGGFVNPNNCSRCLCPSAFGGYLCDERAPAAFGTKNDCGDTLEAKETYQMINGEVFPAGPMDKNNHTVRQAECHYHIKARPGYQVEVKVMNITGPCTNECSYGALEIKFEDFTWTGARLCCPTHVDDTGGVMISEGNLATVSYYTQKGPLKAFIQYREILHDDTLPTTTSEPDEDGSTTTQEETTEGTTGESTTEATTEETTDSDEDEDEEETTTTPEETTEATTEETDSGEEEESTTTQPEETTTERIATTSRRNHMFPTLFPTVPGRKLPNHRCHDIAINCAYQLMYCRSVPAQMQKYCSYSCEFCEP